MGALPASLIQAIQRRDQWLLPLAINSMAEIFPGAAFDSSSYKPLKDDCQELMDELGGMSPQNIINISPPVIYWPRGSGINRVSLHISNISSQTGLYGLAVRMFPVDGIPEFYAQWDVHFDSGWVLVEEYVNAPAPADLTIDMSTVDPASENAPVRSIFRTALNATLATAISIPILTVGFHSMLPAASWRLGAAYLISSVLALLIVLLRVIGKNSRHDQLFWITQVVILGGTGLEWAVQRNSVFAFMAALCCTVGLGVGWTFTRVPEKSKPGKLAWLIPAAFIIAQMALTFLF